MDEREYVCWKFCGREGGGVFRPAKQALFFFLSCIRSPMYRESVVVLNLVPAFFLFLIGYFTSTVSRFSSKKKAVPGREGKTRRSGPCMVRAGKGKQEDAGEPRLKTFST